MNCFACKKELSPGSDDWVECSKCIRSFHLYCLEPILLMKPPEGWWCSSHVQVHPVPSIKSNSNLNLKSPPLNQNGNQQLYSIPKNSYSLDFFPPSIVKKQNRRTRLPPVPSIIVTFYFFSFCIVIIVVQNRYYE